MKLIEKLSERIEEEIHDVKLYAKMACELKHDHPQLAHALYSISTQEEAHQQILHGEVVKLIEAYRKEHGEPPVAMTAMAMAMVCLAMTLGGLLYSSCSAGAVEASAALVVATAAVAVCVAATAVTMASTI